MRNPKFVFDLDSFSNQRFIYLTPFAIRIILIFVLTTQLKVAILTLNII